MNLIYFIFYLDNGSIMEMCIYEFSLRTAYYPINRIIPNVASLNLSGLRSSLYVCRYYVIEDT